MNWIRCVRCRTVGDREQSAACLGCGAPFGDGPAITAPATQREARRDLKASISILNILGLIGVAGLIVIFAFPKSGIAVGTALADFIFLGFLFTVHIGRWIVRRKFNFLASAFLAVAGLAAAFFGAFLLVALACSPSL